MTDGREVPARRWWKSRTAWVLIALFALPVGCGVQAAFAPGASEKEACVSAARSAFSVPDSSTGVTFTGDSTDGLLVKGVVTVRHGGEKIPVRYWECVDGRITWSSTTG